MHARACPAATNRSRPGSRLPGLDIKARTDRIDIINLAESKGKTTEAKMTTEQPTRTPRQLRWSR
jgi:hypothetical protein